MPSEREPIESPRRRVRPAAACALGALLLCAPLAASEWRLVPEMEAPDGVVVDSADRRAALNSTPEAQAAVAGLENLVRRRWKQLRAVDWHSLSRRQIDSTAGWTLPETPGELVGRVLGRDGRGRLHVEVRGPRLPARFAIVHRYVYAFATVDPLTREIDDLLVTIRGWIEE